MTESTSSRSSTSTQSGPVEPANQAGTRPPVGDPASSRAIAGIGLSPRERLKPLVLDLAALAFISVLVLLFFWRIITPRLQDRAVFPPGDFTDQFWAFRTYEARAFAQGRLPLWSDNFNSGHPFLADVQSAIFYPIGLAWMLLVVAVRGADFTLLDLEIEAIAHFVLTGMFTYLFVRRLIGSRAAAVVSAITFTFGGYLTSYPPLQLAILETATWMPLALLLLDLAIERGTRYYAAAGLVLGIAALAGHPQTFLFVAYACAVYFVWRMTLVMRREPDRRSLAIHHGSRFVLALVIAAGIAAAQAIPTLEYQTVSTRSAISWADASGGFPNIDPLQMILPGFTSAFQSPLYLGVLPLWLAVLALFVNRTRDKAFWGLFALGSLLVAFGAYAFAYVLFYLLAPGFAMFRDQERLALVVSFALAVLAGYGMRELIQPALDLKRARRAWALLPAGVTITAVMTLTLYVAGAQRASGRLAFLTDRAGLMVLLFVLAAALIAWRLGRRTGGAGASDDRVATIAFPALAVALIAFDLFTVNSAAYNAPPDPRFPQTPITQAIQSDHSLYRVADEGKMPGHFGIPYNLDEIGGISPLRVARYDDLLNELAPEKLWPLLNVRYVITGRPGFAQADVATTDGETHLLRLQNTLPRAWFVGSAQRLDDPAALEAMKSDAFDPRTTAVVANAVPFAMSQASGADVTVIEHEPERIVLSVDAPVDGLVMTSEVYYPGWRATVDGVDAPILRADYAFRAVAVGAGPRHIEMVYDPASVKAGIVIMAATLAALALGFGVARLGRRRRAASASGMEG